MKKRILLLALLLFPLSVFAKNKINSIEMEIYLNENGSANITEKWEVKGSDGTEWYKVINGIEEVENFNVLMDGKKLIYKNWNVNESLAQKSGYYGINYTSVGLELCFGKGDYEKHTFILNYTINDFIYNTSDSQVLYWNLIDKLSNVDFRDFKVVVSSYYAFPDTLDVWGYGYKGYAYVKDGKIYMQNEENTNMNDKYVVLLAKFPLETFKAEKVFPKAENFNEVLNMAKEGSFAYDYNETSKFEKIYNILRIVFYVGLFSLITWRVRRAVINNSYGYRNNKKIDKKDTHMFRDIPCNKDIYYADTLIKLNNFVPNGEANLIGAIILKWVKENKITFINEKKGLFNKDTSSIDLRGNPTFSVSIEQKLFDIMYKASGDGILSGKELEKWCRRNYEKFYDLFKNRREEGINELKSQNHIYERHSKEECKYKNVMDDKIYEDSKELLGLKLYFDEFASMDTKEVMEVKIWDEYLMFAYLFGVADKVAKQLKNLYPKMLENYDYDFDTIVFINNISTSSVRAASSARSAAESYSSGGGGFSSGGGGGGSFGGGGGGSR